MVPDILPAGLGLLGAALLSDGHLLPAQVLFGISNPILAYGAYRAGSKPVLLMYLAFTFFSIRGALHAL